MGRGNPYERQTSRDVQRAVALVSRVRGLTADESVEALEERATHTGVSIHAAALAVMATSPTDELLIDRPVPVPQQRTHGLPPEPVRQQPGGRVIARDGGRRPLPAGG